MNEDREGLDGGPARSDAPDSTLTLLQRARAGDAAAMDVLFARCLPPLLRWARGRLPRGARSMQETRDIVQDAVVKSLARLDAFEPTREGALQAYLRLAVLNRIRDEYRTAARRPGQEDVDVEEAHSAAPSPLEQAIGRENVERYERALARLPADDREAIIARLELGLPFQAMATALGRPTADAARQALRRALARLTEEMSRER